MKGLLFISVYGPQDFLAWNEKMGVAVLGNAQSNNTGVSTYELETCRLKDLKAKLARLKELGYKIIDGTKSDSEPELKKIMPEFKR